MDQRWRELRVKVIERDKSECQACGSYRNLHVHHLRYISGKQPWEYDLDDLLTLCRHCHAIISGVPVRPRKHPWHLVEEMFSGYGEVSEEEMEEMEQEDREFWTGHNTEIMIMRSEMLKQLTEDNDRRIRNLQKLQNGTFKRL